MVTYLLLMRLQGWKKAIWMPNWNQVFDEVESTGSTYDIIRRKYLKELSDYTKRNTIIYYSGWLQKRELIQRGVIGFEVNDEDKEGFMSCINKMPRDKGLDLILHTPGGETAATESLVEYLRSLFGNDIRAIIPQIAMSAGTMIACSCKQIIMGKQSSLGPIDPQLGNGIPASGIIEEFRGAYDKIKSSTTPQETQAAIALWQPIIAKYNPTLIGECEKAIKWSNEIVREWLISGMFDGDKEGETKADKIIQELGNHALTKSHSRHISISKAKEIGLKIVTMEDDQELQDKILSLHHICMQTLESGPAIKLIENQDGTAFIKSIATNMSHR